MKTTRHHAAPEFGAILDCKFLRDDAVLAPVRSPTDPRRSPTARRVAIALMVAAASLTGASRVAQRPPTRANTQIFAPVPSLTVNQWMAGAFGR